MQKIKKTVGWFLCILFLLNVGLPAALAKDLPSGKDSTELEQEVTAFVNENERTTAGMAVAVFDAESILYQDTFGFADKKNDFPVNDDTVFEWGSASKALIWVSVMQLEEQGLIDLGADIHTYLPSNMLTKMQYDEPITITHLMNHTAGFQNVMVDLFVPEGGKYGDLEETLKKTQPAQIYAPGTTTAYSNWSAALAAYIVERVSDMPYRDYVKQHIFEPLGMEHTAIAPDLSDNPGVLEKRKTLQGYTASGQPTQENLFYHIPLYPAGMGTGTPADFVRFAQALIPTDGAASPLFQHPETLDKMLEPTSFFGDSDIPRNNHGLWTEFYAVRVLGHSGNTACCSSSFQIDPASGIGMVVMTNQRNETRYNKDMPGLVFGSFEDNPLAGNLGSLPEGLYYDATTIHKGPFSITQIMSWRPPNSGVASSFWMEGNQDGTDKILIPYRDLIQQDSFKTGIIAAVMLLWIVGVFYAFFTLFMSLIGVIFRAVGSIPKSGEGIVVATCPFEKWHMLACGLILFGFVNLLQFIVNIFSYAGSTRMTIQLGVFAVIMLLLIAYIGWLIAQWKRMDCMKAEKIKYAVTAFFAGTSVLMIVFWELYRFWVV